MKKTNLLTRSFVAVTIWTGGFLCLAAFSAEKAYHSDPDLLKKIENKYNVRIDTHGFSYENSSHKEEMEDSWTFKVPREKISIKLYSGDVAIRSTSGNEIEISATGKTDANKVSRLLETETNSEELIIRQTKNSDVENLSVQISIPNSFSKDLRIVNVSGDISIENLNVHDLDLKNVSGSINLKQLKANTLDVMTVSGDFFAETASFTKLAGKSVSGKIDLTNNIPADIDITSVSGEIKLRLAKSQDTHFSLKSFSGEIHNKLDDNKNGKHKVDIHTTSGDIKIE